MRTMEPDAGAVQSLETFFVRSCEAGDAGERFGNESARMLRIEVDGGVWLKPGAAIAYRGDLTFERLPAIRARSIKDAVMRETAPLVRAAGKGRLFCGRHGSHVEALRLSGDGIFVAWQDLLAFEDSLAFDVALVGHGLGVAAGGLIAVRLSGHGTFAMATHGQPLTLPVAPGNPVSTDPHATLAWTNGLTPALKTDLSWRSCFGHGGHEPVQMLFEGTGMVVVQPYEDPARLRLEARPLERVVASLAG